MTLRQPLNSDLPSVRTGAARFEQEQIGKPIWDRIYRNLWPLSTGELSIERELDEHLLATVVDVFCRDAGYPFKLTGQEKTLGHYYGQNYDTLTVEYMQNPLTGEEGDAFNINVNFYSVGYLNKEETDFTHGAVVNWAKLVNWSWRGRVNWHYNNNSKSNARASFMYCNLAEIPPACYLWRKPRLANR